MLAFEQGLERAGYAPKDRNALIDAIDDGHARELISMSKLTGYLNKLRKPASEQDIRGTYGQFDTTIRAKIAKISQFM